MATSRQESRRHRRFRVGGRWLVLVAAVALAWPLGTSLPTPVVLPALSPFVMLCAGVAQRSVGMLALLALPVLLLALIIPRFFCRYACPTGLLQETLEGLCSLSIKSTYVLGNDRLTTEADGGAAAGRTGTSARWPPVGKWLVFLTLGGACLGYPLFLWLDPLALFQGFLNAWRLPLSAAGLMGALGLLLLLLLDVFRPRLWCRRICPLGATQDLLARPGLLLARNHRCATETGDRAAGYDRRGLARRGFFAVCGGAAAAIVVRAARGQSAPPLRPPGALEEQRFTGVCVRCGNCATACPARIIRPDLGVSGVAGLMTPVLCFEADYCREDCHRCNEVCPSGALARLTLAEKRGWAIGPAVVDLDSCLLANGRECTACISRCSYEAVVRQDAADGFGTVPRVDLKRCTGCGACEAACPVRPRRAIRVVARSPNATKV